MILRRSAPLALSLVLCAPPAGAGDFCAAVTPAIALAQVNSVRALGGRCDARGTFAATASLTWSPALERAAQQQADWLAAHDELVHTGPQGQTLAQRATEAGYRPARVTENLAHGQADVAAVVTAWTGSESHCANLYDAAVSEMALACRPGADGRPLWVLVLGRPR